MKIANISFKNGIFLAPLAGVTDKTFRSICKEKGAELVYSEMISAKALYYKDKKTFKLSETDINERPIAIQIFGNDPSIMAYAAEKLSERDDICIIDINMGCPVSKIVKNGEGSALLNDLVLAGQIIESVVKSSIVPVTVKTRIGWEDTSNALMIAKMIEESGASAICVHGRTKSQMYSGKADWETIKNIKKNSKIPVIGNGDIFTGEDAKRAIEHSGVDGIMIARGALGNPWIFEEIKAVFEKEEYKKPSYWEICETILKQITELEKDVGAYSAIRQMRKHLAWYTKGMHGCAAFKNKVFDIKDMDQLKNEIERFFSYAELEK